MPELPEPIRRLNRHSGIAELAHVTIFDDHSAIVELGAADAESAAVVRASAEIALTEVPRLLRDVNVAAIRWEEQDLLDPVAAATTLQRISAALDALDGPLKELHRRHADLAARMRHQLDRARRR